MFKCKICGKNQEAGVPVNQVVVETRERVYTNYYVDEEERTHKKVTMGTEIVKEVAACKPCADNVTVK